jgi:hypothetical protein
VQTKSLLGDGEVRQAQLFVAVPEASNYAFATATAAQTFVGFANDFRRHNFRNLFQIRSR